MEHQILGPCRCDTVPKCFDVDLTIELICNIEATWKRGVVAELLAVDVGIAFDSSLT